MNEKSASVSQVVVPHVNSRQLKFEIIPSQASREFYSRI